MAIDSLFSGNLAFTYEQIEVLKTVLPRHLYTYWPIPGEAAFLTTGAHAVIARCPSLRRGPQRYRQAFPGLRLITPESPPAAPRPPPR